ncbi:MAG: carboxypeptidase-like regulatory domain-containing protein [Cyclobacteriaceae bacterium]|nr:carboxypeptidase-like regulatory domain-containing protein [Cyclobacteriaceae bacterium]
MYSNIVRLKVRLKVLVWLVLSPVTVLAQETVIRGKITDAFSGDPIPFVNVVFKGTSIGTTTDFDGNYVLRTTSPTDSLQASYIGYKPRTKVVQKGISQTINFQLEEEVTRLRDIVIMAGENPAFAVLRNVVKNKAVNDKRKLSAYEFDSYSKIEIDVDNITDKFKQKKIVSRITQVLDSIQQIAGEDGQPVLPIFISESVSKFYYRNNPELKFENIKETKISGIGFEDGSLMAQLVGASFQEYNFYKNWLNILDKDFVSPIADGWRLYYEYDLMDSLDVEGDYCYRLDFFPKSPQALAFTGTMWITKNEYAIKRIEVTVGKEANLNFIEKIKIQQELAKTEAGAWIPVKNRVLVDAGEVRDQWAGLLAKFYTSNRNIVVNQPKEPKFYEKQILLDEGYILNMNDEEHWNKLRHDPLTETEKNVYRMIDTLQHIPVVRTYIDLVKILINGYKKVGKVDIGPYLSLVAFNNIEGVRIQSGFKTNYTFSKKVSFGAQLAYGFDDERIKYSAFVQHIVDRKRWTTMSIRVRSDLGRVGIDDENLADDYLFLAATRFGVFRRGYYFDESRFNFQRELIKGFSQRVAVRYNTFKPVFDFGYYTNPGDISSLQQNFQTAEVILESRFARDELFLQYDNERVSMGAQKWPIITLRYTRGLKGVGGSDFEYDKYRFSILKKLPMGPLGSGKATITGEYINGTLPYPLLSFHIGNETPFYTDVIYSLMNFGEFFSDRFVSLQYRQYFEGFLLNRVPLMRKLKWRLTGLANVIYGDLKDENLAMSEPLPFPVGNSNLTIDRPYIELGYGVENIFKFLRIDFVHRLSYLENDRARKFGVLFTAQFKL